MKKISALLILLITAVSTGWSSDIRVVIDTGHTGEVTTLKTNSRYNLLFSGGEDGTVRAWDVETRRLVMQLQASPTPILQLTLHPQDPVLAILTKDGLYSYRLTAWDWKKSRELYSIALDDIPTQISFSPRGSWLVYSQNEWKGIVFHNASNGKRLNYLSDGFGLVSSFFLSPSEKMIVTYNQSGKIDYWMIREGERRAEIDTEPDLVNIHYTSNLRFMAGFKEETLYLIDVTTGKTAASLEMGPISAITINQSTNEIACLHHERYANYISAVNYSNEGLIPRSIGRTESELPSTVSYFFDEIFFPSETGTILGYPVAPEEERKEITANSLAPITDLCFRNQTMVFSTETKLGFIDSDFFTSLNSRSIPDSLEVSFLEHTLSNNTFVEASEEGEIFVWDALVGKIYSLDSATRELSSHPLEAYIPLQDLRIMNGRMLAIGRTGACLLYELPSLERTFRFNAYGIKTAVPLRDSLLIGKSGTTGMDTSLFSVNLRTKETLPLADREVMVFDTLYDPKKDTVYTLGIENGRNGTRTVCTELSGSNYSRRKRLFTFNGEDLTAGMAFDQEESVLYTSLGFDSIQGFSGSREATFRQNEHVPRKLYVYNGKLYSLNRDYSITVWDTKTGTKMMTFYLFKDGNWVALLSSGDYYSSEDGDKHLTFYSDLRPVTGTETEKLRQN